VGFFVCLCAAMVAACSGPSSTTGGSPDGAAPLDGGMPDGDMFVTDASFRTDGTAPADASDGSDVDGADAAAGPPPFVDPFGGAAGCDGGIDAGVIPLSLVMPAEGGLSTVIGWKTTFGGGSGGAELVWRAHGPDSTEIDVTIQMNQAISPGVVGPQPAVSLEVRWINQPDGGSVAWLASSGVCSITFDSNVCNQDRIGLLGNQTEYAISGTGVCSAPAMPEPGNAAAPLTIGQFSFINDIVAIVGDN
jgi:hypothetical protein